ncbi:MAG: FkbM family methyltransferase [Oligoflexia bacterium]|nr:FkbM family methyltransferase [Oligoflexia bacterium]
MFRDLCARLEQSPVTTTYSIMQEFDLLDGHPWTKVTQSAVTNYYACLYGIAREERPKKVLEVGVAFGMSGSTLIKSCEPFELYVGIDLAIFGPQNGTQVNNLEFAKNKIHNWCKRNNIPTTRAMFFNANTQPVGQGDNDDLGQDVPRFQEIPELMSVLNNERFDIIFIDGKHTGLGLYNDLCAFWPYLKPGGLAICDDLHDAVTYKGVFSWAGDTETSFQRFIREHVNCISDFAIWDFPRVPPDEMNGLRPFGLVRKSAEADQPGHEVKTTNDSPIFFQDFLGFDWTNNRIKLPQEVKRVWLDVGANEAETTTPALQSEQDLAIIAFEPLPDKWEKLVNKHPRLIALPFAVSSIAGVAAFNRTANNVSSSLQSFSNEGLAEWKDTRGLEIVEQLLVGVCRLETVAARLPVERIEFAKIDAQGCDLDVVKSLGTLLPRVDVLKLEVAVTKSQLYEGGATREEMTTYLLSRGFKLASVENQTNDQEQNLTFVNTRSPSAQDTFERLIGLRQVKAPALEELTATSESEYKRLAAFNMEKIKANPHDPVAWTAFAILAYSQGDIHNFTTAFKQAQALDPYHPRLLQLEACIRERSGQVLQEAGQLADKGDLANATTLVETLYEDFPSSQEAAVAIGRYFLATKQADKFNSVPFLVRKRSVSESDLTCEQYVHDQELAYLRSNPDVAAAVNNRSFKSGWEHYVMCGHREGRPYFAQPNRIGR